MVYDMRLKPFVTGLCTYLPVLGRLAGRGTGGTVSARYCYSVWLRHLIKAAGRGLEDRPAVVAELGPGDSLGIGLAALLTGSEKYYAFDVVNHSNIDRNISVFHELVNLLRARAPIPDAVEFPWIRPVLADYSFPTRILTDERLEKALATKRVNALAECLARPIDAQQHKLSGAAITTFIPWFGSEHIIPGSVDVIFSQAVLEHVDDLQLTYNAMRKWLKPGGHMSHTIDFRSHGLTSEWNGHWAMPDLAWKVIRGRRPFLINRVPLSLHIHLLRESGFSVVDMVSEELPPGIQRSDVATRFQWLSDEDLKTGGVFLLAR